MAMAIVILIILHALGMTKISFSLLLNRLRCVNFNFFLSSLYMVSSSDYVKAVTYRECQHHITLFS